MAVKGKQIKIILLNRNYPPQNGVTGHSANELFEFLNSKQKFDLNVIHVNGKYNGNSFTKTEVYGKKHIINTFYNGKLKLFRLFSSLFEGYMLAKKAISMNPDYILSMTDPPLLNFWTSILTKKKKIQWIYWSMDLYPEAFASAGLLKKNGFIYKFFEKKLKVNRPKFIISLGNLQLRYLIDKYNYNLSSVIFPCGITSVNKKRNTFIEKHSKNKISFCYAGNLGEAHNSSFVMNVIDNIDPKKHVFFLSVYGSKAHEVIEYSKAYSGVHIIKSIERENMHLIDIHLVSLLENWDHVCVPSKAISAVSQGSTILFESTKNNDNWQLLKGAGWRLNFNNHDEVSKFMFSISVKEIIYKRKKASEISEQLTKIKKDAFDQIYNHLNDNYG